MTATPTSQDAAFDSFLRAIRTDEDWGYPDNAAFIGLKVEEAPELAWDALREGRDVVFVTDAGAEMWIERVRDQTIALLIDRFTRRIPVRLWFRTEPAVSDEVEMPLLRVTVSRRSFPETVGHLRHAPTAVH